MEILEVLGEDSEKYQLSEAAQGMLGFAYQLAKSNQSEFVTPEHVFYALATYPYPPLNWVPLRASDGSEISNEMLHQTVLKATYFGETDEDIIAQQLEFSPEVTRCLWGAMSERSDSRGEVDIEHIFYRLVMQEDEYILELFERFGIDYEGYVHYMEAVGEKTQHVSSIRRAPFSVDKASGE